MSHISHALFSWLPRFHNKTPFIQVVINTMISILIIIIAAGIVSFIRKNMDQRIALAREKLLLLRALEERQTLFVNLSNDYKRLVPIFSALYSVLPHREEVIMFADTIEAVARETGNTIAFQFETNEPSSDPVFATVARVQFRASIEGTGETFNQFLRRLKTLRYIHSIDTIHIEGSQGIYGAVTVHLNGTVFIQKSGI